MADQTEHRTPEQIADATTADVKRTVEHLRAGRTTRSEAEEVKDAATRAIADKDVARSIGRHG